MEKYMLYKGKRIDNGEWVIGYLCFIYIDNPRKARMYSPDDVKGYDVITETVGKCVGLPDKHGADIFDGDIVYDCSSDEEGDVFWHKETASHCIRFDTCCVNFDEVLSKELEVVGNIYDGGEVLLKWKV